MSLPRSDDLKKALTDPRKVIEECGYKGQIITEGGGFKIACPWHPDSGRPNLSVRIGPDGTIQVKCFSCQKGGSVFDLIMGLRGITDFKAVVAEAARIAGMGPAAKPSPNKLPRDEYPDPESVRRFWNQAVDLLSDAELCEQLRARGIPPEMIRNLARALPEVGWNPRWEWVRAEPKPIRWRAAGYRLLLPLYDTQGKHVSVHARRFGIVKDSRKGTNPIGKAHGLVLLNPTAISQPTWHDAIIVEGAPSFLVVAALYSERPVIGVLAGSCKGIELSRIPRGAEVTIWTDNEIQMRPDGSSGPGAGEKYKGLLIAALARRRIRVVTVPIPDGEKKAPAADDIYKVAGMRGVEAALASAELQTLAADADAHDIWERAAGLDGVSALPGLDMGQLDDREVLRCSGGVLITRAYNEFGEHVANAHSDAHPGWLADDLGVRFLQTGEAGPSGVLITQGFVNFLALAQHFASDEPGAPAILAGPPPATVPSCRLMFWPPQHYEADHWVVRASDPAVAAEIGAHAVVNILNAAQFVSIDRPIPPPDDKPRQDFPRTDIGNAERLAYYYGEDLRYVYDWKEFLVWDGHRWARDRTFEAQRRATVVTRLMYSGSDADKEWAHKSEGSDKHHSMVALLREQPNIPILPERLDADAYLLNVKNGTLDLRTGRLLSYDRRNLITKNADVTYNRGAQCIEWLRFLDRIFEGNQNLISYIQRAAGYSMTGDNKEEKMFVLFGKGRNGKSTFMLTLQSILGDYSQPMSADLLIAQGDKNKLDAGQLSAIAALRGARFVAASETDEGAKIGEKTFKQLVKRDSISAKFMGKDMFDFLPSHKLWLCTNHRLRVSGKDRGFWSALIEIPFKVTIPDSEIDRALPARLMAERSGILNWLLAGCLEWQRKGLQQPPEIDASIKAYQQEMDYIQPFLHECCDVGQFKRVKIAVLRTVYEYWCKQTAKDPMGNRTFARLLEEKFPAGSSGEARFRDGLEIKPAWLELLKMSERNFQS